MRMPRRMGKMFLVVARDGSRQMVKRIGASTEARAREWMAEFVAELPHGTVTIDEADPHGTPTHRITTAWVN